MILLGGPADGLKLHAAATSLRFPLPTGDETGVVKFYSYAADGRYRGEVLDTAPSDEDMQRAFRMRGAIREAKSA